MFSSKELISFVFANENDTYYGEDLLKLDLNQHLWERLHGSYDAVYFLSAEGSSFRVRSYGDLSCGKYTPEKKSLFKLFGGSSEQQDQGEWILQQLRAKPGKTAAFVCPLEDFCSVLSDDRWDSVLADIVAEKKRTGIFVLTASATAEQTAQLLLESPVFEKLRETAVTDLRGGALRELYGTLKKRKWDSCLFLNSFTWERVRALLLHLVMEYPERMESTSQLDVLTDYLYAWLRDPEAAGGELLSEQLPAGYLTYGALYTQLRKEHTWHRLEKESQRYAASDHRQMTRDSAVADAVVLRDMNSYAGRCLKLRLPGWIQADEEKAHQARSLLRSIQSAVRAPKNRMENKQIAAAAGSILDLVDTVRRSDTDTLTQVLSALKFCVNHVYTEEKGKICEQVLEIIQKHRDTIHVSDQCFCLRQDLERAKAFSGADKLTNYTLMQQQVQLEKLEQARKTYTDLISARELGLNMPATSGSITDLMSNLEQEIRDFETRAQEPVCIPEPEPEIPKFEETPEPEIQEEEEEMEINEEEVNWDALYDSYAPNFS